MSIKVKGADRLLKKLKRLEKKDAAAAQRKAAAAGGRAMAKVIRPEVPKDEGVTRKATTFKTVGRGRNAGAIAGADMAKLTEGEARPSNVDHLLEYGHVTPEGIFVPPSGYFRRTAPQATAAGEAAYIAKLSDEIGKALSR
jgi:hypothetical protein